jgi:single-strand DNA-binding protein
VYRALPHMNVSIAVMPSAIGDTSGRTIGLVSQGVSVARARVAPRKGGDMVTVNVVVLAGTVAADPVQRRMPSGDEVTELRLSVPEAGRLLLPLPVAAWHATVGARTVDGIAKGDAVLVHGQLVRRFYRSGAGARSLTEVVATGIKKLEQPAA